MKALKTWALRVTVFCWLVAPLSAHGNEPPTAIVVWGASGDGQTNLPGGLTNVVAVSAGARHGLALKADGTVLAWGYNGDNQAEAHPLSQTR